MFVFQWFNDKSLKQETKVEKKKFTKNITILYVSKIFCAF